MIGRRCDGCGRLLGVRNDELSCPCWTSVNEGATIPERLIARTKRAQRLRDGKEKA